MDSVPIDWFWFGLLVVVIVRALAVSSFGVRTFRDHHNIKFIAIVLIFISLYSIQSYLNRLFTVVERLQLM